MKKNTKGNTARANHIIPQFYLAGFTDSGKKDGKLYAHDLLQLKSWRSAPAGVGHQRDFYRIDLPGRKPDEIEKLLDRYIESPAADVIRTIATDKVVPSGKDFAMLMQFIALMAVRVQSIREAAARFEEDWARQTLRLHAELPPEELSAVIERHRKNDPDFPDLSAEDFKSFVESNEYIFEVPQDFHMRTFVTGHLANLPEYASIFGQRTWTLLVAESYSNDFVCTDHPVVLNWTIEVPPFYQAIPGFGMRGTVVNMPLTRHLALVGNLNAPGQAVPPHGMTLPASKNMVARINRLVTKRAIRFVYSAEPDFLWERADGTIGSTSDLLEAVEEEQNNGRTS